VQSAEDGNHLVNAGNSKGAEYFGVADHQPQFAAFGHSPLLGVHQYWKSGGITELRLLHVDYQRCLTAPGQRQACVIQRADVGRVDLGW